MPLMLMANISIEEEEDKLVVEGVAGKTMLQVTCQLVNYATDMVTMCSSVGIDLMSI